MSANIKAAIFMMISMLAFTLNDTFVKTLGGHLSLGQILATRGTIASVFIFGLVLYYRQYKMPIPKRDRWLIALRTLSEFGATYFFLTALFQMPLANLTALLQLLPLIVTGAGAIIFREPLGWRRLSAIIVGFGGMLLIVRPGTEGFNLYTIYGLICVAFVAVRDLSTRAMSPATPSIMVTLIASISISIFGFTLGIGETWDSLSNLEWFLMVSAATCVAAGYFFSIQVMRIGQLYISTPFRYTGLVWALLLGWLVFGDWPSDLTLIGAGIIIATGLFTLYREYVRAAK